jgi:hypothetical protein
MVSRTFRKTVIALLCLGLFIAAQRAHGQTQVPKLKIGTLGAPSTSVWMVGIGRETVRLEKRHRHRMGQATDHGRGLQRLCRRLIPGRYRWRHQLCQPVRAWREIEIVRHLSNFRHIRDREHERESEINAPKDLNGKEIAAPLASENTKAMEI